MLGVTDFSKKYGYKKNNSHETALSNMRRENHNVKVRNKKAQIEEHKKAGTLTREMIHQIYYGDRK